MMNNEHCKANKVDTFFSPLHMSKEFVQAEEDYDFFFMDEDGVYRDKTHFPEKNYMNYQRK